MKKFLKNYGFILFMLLGIVAGCIVGALFPVVKNAAGDVVNPGATVLEPLGTIFVNLMFCIVVPMVFCSIASAIANMESMKKAGKIMGITVVTFLITAAIAPYTRVCDSMQDDNIRRARLGNHFRTWHQRVKP